MSSMSSATRGDSASSSAAIGVAAEDAREPAGHGEALFGGIGVGVAGVQDRQQQGAGADQRDLAGVGAGDDGLVDVFVTTKLWNTNHRPERVRSAFDASLRRLQVNYVDAYLIQTPGTS
jgi:Aldo/keto reductase family